MIPALAQVLRSKTGGPRYSSLTFKGSNTDTSNSSSYTFTAVDVGAASPRRYVIVAIGTFSGIGSISSVTIGGNVATDIVTAGQITIRAFNLTSGTTADIVVNYGSSQLQCHMAWWTVNMDAITAHASASSNDADGVVARAYDIPAAGFGIAAHICDENVDRAHTFDSGWTEDVETFAEVNGAFGHIESTPAVTGTLNSTFAGVVSSSGRLIYASWDGAGG